MIWLRAIWTYAILLASVACEQHYFVQDSDHNIDIKPLPRSPTLEPNSSFVLKKGRNGAISSDSEYCSRLAVEHVLQKYDGANAADAAVTVALCLGMKNFFSSGIGGGGYAVFVGGHKAAERPEPLFIDFREQAPALAHKHMFDMKPNASQVGGLAVAIPGELKGLHELYASRGSGKVAWRDLLEPVAELGTTGWPVDELTAATLKMYEPYFLNNSSDWSFLLNRAQTRVKTLGEKLRRPALARVLRELAANGSAAPFYDPDHWIVKSLIGKIRETGGIATEQDFANYFVNVSQPLSKRLRHGWQNLPNNDITVYTSAGSSSGPALLSALQILDHFPNHQGGDFQRDQTFQLIEAMKWMASSRSRLGDFSKCSEIPERVLAVLNSSWTDHAVSKMKPQDGVLRTLANWTEYAPAYELTEPHGTTHFSVVDKFGSAVTITSTVNLLFGSLVHDPATGIILNNEMDDFSQPGRKNAFELAPSAFNFVEPGKRPLSSAAPTVVLDELEMVDLVIGAAGGSRITTSLLQALVRTYWYDMPLLETIAYPRVHHQLIPEHIEAESFHMMGKEAISSLEKMGHKIIETPPKSVVNGIRRVRGEWHAVSDYWRKRGLSATY
ncbi:LAMI_0G06524g1_1 [Lachancea mirantina]|uniref:Glutathione hydrolase n=1 Tax=Lachancea mirantina TaxID=1230905 RepID=A0A1G4K993_9SACH|nr:LAMI_0G06524g1_1 [Lachancea mirantina]